MRALQAERLAEGEQLDAAVIDEVAREAAVFCNPVSSSHGTTEYRKAVIEEMVARALRRAVQRAGV